MIRKNLAQRKLGGILANTNSVELSSFQGIGFQIYLIVFTSLVMSNLLVFVSFFDMLKKNVMYLSLIPSFGSFIQLLSVSFPSPPTSSLWVKDNWYLLFYLFLLLCPVLARSWGTNEEKRCVFLPLLSHVKSNCLKGYPMVRIYLMLGIRQTNLTSWEGF